MKKLSTTLSLAFFLSIIITPNVIGQKEASKWSFGAQVGVNVLHIPKIDVDDGWFSSASSTVNADKDRFSFELRGVAKYDMSQEFKLITGLGVTHAKASATRWSSETDYLLFFGSDNTIKRDTIEMNFTTIDLPIALRWQIISEESKKYHLGLYVDGGLNLLLPIKSDINYGLQIDKEFHESGDLKLNNFSYFFSIGISHKKGSFEWRWQRLNTTKDADDYKSSIRSFVYTRYF